MTYLSLGLPLDVIDSLCWALIHFLWQGAVLAALLYAILLFCRSAVARHNWALATIVAMAVAPIITFFWLDEQKAAHLNQASRAIPPSISAFFPNAASSISYIRTLPDAAVSPAWMNLLVVFWVAGIAVLSLRALGGLYLAETLRRRNISVLAPELLHRCQSLQQRLALNWPIRFLQSTRITAPIVVGWLRPVVLIPVAAIIGLSLEELDALVLHELAHIRRLDAFVNVLLVAAETVLFYHPAVWWVSRQVRLEREHCCDDFAVSHCGDVAVYVEALTSLATARSASEFALAANGGNLKARVSRLLGVSVQPRGRFSALAALALLGFLTAGWGAWAQSVVPTAFYELPTIATSLQNPQGGLLPMNVRVALGLASDDDRLALTTQTPRLMAAVANYFDTAPRMDLQTGLGNIADAQAELLRRVNAVSPVSVRSISLISMQIQLGTAGPPYPNGRLDAVIEPSHADVTRALAEQIAPRKAVSFDPAQFDKFTGRYQFTPTLIATVRRDGDHFIAKLPGRLEMEMRPESGSKFFFTWVLAQISFVQNARGEVTGLILHQNGFGQGARKIDEATAIKAATLASRTTASPGTETALRTFLEGRIKGQVSYDLLTPALANTVRNQPWPYDWGALKSLAFNSVGAAGADIYLCEFEKASAECRIFPLVDGKISLLQFSKLSAPTPAQ